MLELGSGCGLAGIAAGCLASPRLLVLTDYQESTVDNLRQNVASNSARLGSLAVQVARMDWDAPESWPQGDEGSPLTFDLLIGADLLYRRSYARKVASVVQQLLCPGGLFLCVTPEHREGLPLLHRLLLGAGFDVTSQEAPDSWRCAAQAAPVACFGGASDRLPQHVLLASGRASPLNLMLLTFSLSFVEQNKPAEERALRRGEQSR